MVLKKSVRVWQKYRPRSVMLESKDVPEEALLFESEAIAILSPVEVDIIRREFAETISAYGCLGVLKVIVGEETFQYLVLCTGCQSVGKVWDTEVFRVTQTTFAPLCQRGNLELVQEVGKLLACGKFYFSYPSNGAAFDILVSAQQQGKDLQTQFCWNRGLYAYMKQFGVDCSKWLFRIMCGNVDIQTVYSGEKQAKLCLISRLNCERAGTRYNVRGVNDEGHVGNFVETEQAIYVDSSVSSFVQIRGSVPLFWEQPGLQTTGGYRIKLSRGYFCSHPAFERHFEWCLLHYGPLLCINLLGTRNMELMLTTAFQEHFAQLSPAYCAEMVCFDYHQHCKGGPQSRLALCSVLLPLAQDFLAAHGFFQASSGHTERNQTGVMRANCLDCLDRTNAVQTFFGLHLLPQLLSAVGLSTKSSMLSRFEQLLSQAWTHNGDAISRMYTGTKAMEGRTKLRDGARSVQRTILSNFLDSSKQEAIEMLLFGNAFSGELGQKVRALLALPDALAPVPFKQAMVDRWYHYTVPEKLRVCIGTWNVNGGKHIRSVALRKDQSMHDWLLDAPFIAGAVKEFPEEFMAPPDVFAIGFQELVGLTASNIVSASATNRREWGMELQKVLSRDEPYELLTAEQLVGVCLYIFIRPKLIPYVRDVGVVSVKTGMSGKAGNKGAVAIRFLLHSTSICFVCAHFAAHQTKIMERNQDFTEIFKRVQFSQGPLDSHDYIFWCGDLNYRVDLPTSLAKDHIAHRHWDRLHKFDQLIKQKKLKRVFRGFIEGELNFAPTYKYDEFSDDYDTSEKCRTPAWCDRVLWRRKPFQSNPSDQAMSGTGTEEEEEAAASATSRHLDFGLYPSDTAEMCGSLMDGGGGGGQLVSVGHPWHPGRLLHYGRAELKQSDHRPVVALLEVDVYRVDEQQRARLREEVALLLGPPDPTVCVREREDGASVSIPQLLEAFRQFGEVILVRMTDDMTLVTYRRSQSAMAATAFSGKEVDGVTVDVCLRSSWPPTNGEGEGVKGEGEEMTEHHQRQNRPERFTVLTGSQLAPLGPDKDPAHPGEDPAQPGEEPEELLEFSFAEDGDTRRPTSSQDSVEPEPDCAGGMEQELPDGNETELQHQADVENEDSGQQPSSSSQAQGRPQHLEMPPKAERPQRPSLPPRHVQDSASSPGGEGSTQRPARPPRPQPSVVRDRAVSQPVPLSHGATSTTSTTSTTEAMSPTGSVQIAVTRPPPVKAGGGEEGPKRPPRSKQKGSERPSRPERSPSPSPRNRTQRSPSPKPAPQPDAMVKPKLPPARPPPPKRT